MNEQFNLARETSCYANIHELSSTSELVQANELLGQGWGLLAIKEETQTKVREGQPVVESKFIFIFGRAITVEAQGPSASLDKDVELELESLPWKPSASGKCDFVKAPPDEILEAVRNNKRGIKGKLHHLATHKTEPASFRFRRMEGEVSER